MNHLQTLKDYNAWRRGDESLEQPDPKAIGEAIDYAITVIRAAEDLKKAKGRFNTQLAADRLFNVLP
jgi:hypothetical protein